jgi:ascorbate-specific PTS system EIIC-type component UlaA
MPERGHTLAQPTPVGSLLLEIYVKIFPRLFSAFVQAGTGRILCVLMLTQCASIRLTGECGWQLAMMVNIFIQVSAKWAWLGPVVLISDLFMGAVYEASIHPEDMKENCNLSSKLVNS